MNHLIGNEHSKVSLKWILKIWIFYQAAERLFYKRLQIFLSIISSL